jgi:hypothetical protein
MILVDTCSVPGSQAITARSSSIASNLTTSAKYTRPSSLLSAQNFNRQDSSTYNGGLLRRRSGSFIEVVSNRNVVNLPAAIGNFE